MSWTDKPLYEPAPPVDENPWYSSPSPMEPYASTVSTRACYVYLLQSSNAYKIGISRNVPHRIHALSCGSAKRPELVALRRGGRALESRIHRALKRYRLNGEWFKVCREVMKGFWTEPEREGTLDVSGNVIDGP